MINFSAELWLCCIINHCRELTTYEQNHFSFFNSHRWDMESWLQAHLSTERPLTCTVLEANCNSTLTDAQKAVIVVIACYARLCAPDIVPIGMIFKWVPSIPYEWNVIVFLCVFICSLWYGAMFLTAWIRCYYLYEAFIRRINRDFLQDATIQLLSTRKMCIV